MTERPQTDRQLIDLTTAVRELTGIMQAGGLSRLDVSSGNVSIRLRAGGRTKPVSSKNSSGDEVSVLDMDEGGDEVSLFIKAPMIGTYYTSPAPGEPQFVRVGERIEAGQIIGIIEAMKIMNEIPAEHSGTVVELMAANAQPVEYGSPLLRLTPDMEDA
jgi:biotin carboxyl carrier protein